MSTKEQLHGLLHLRGDKIVVQWRTSREVSYVGREIRTDRELEPLREVEVPLTGLATARRKRIWRKGLPATAILLTAADLRAFEPLTDEQGVPGLVLEHPAEIVLQVRRSDRKLLKIFISELNLAISEQALLALEREAEQHMLEEADLPAGRITMDAPASGEQSALREGRVRA
ncbi:MAG: hypothetical protein R2834_22140 [Rhodothermales bacterium]